MSDLQAIVRMPTVLFYAQTFITNVIEFDNKPAA